MFIRSVSVFLYSGLLCAASAPTFPVLTYSTFLRDSFTPKAIATDVSGNIYIAGNAIVDPATSQSTVLVVKLNPQATQYVYVRYLGGSVNDQANALAVDLAGDVYLAGSTTSPDFPVSGGGLLGTQPPSPSSRRSFVAKLDPNGDLVFSDLLGGYSSSAAQAVAVTALNQILVSGTSTTSGFPSTGGAYTIGNTAQHPYLLELDPTGATTLFSATGIGGSSIALDSSGNIYVAGTTYLLDYPTTPGTYQSTFPVFNVCLGPCESPFQGANQYVTKVDPTGSKLIYSTSVSGSGQTMNAGLAVDAAGDVYLTGYAGASYPYTVAAPPLSDGGSSPTFASPFLSRLDPLGQTLLYSVPVGGAGVQVDSSGSVYVGGGVGVLLGLSGTYSVPANLPALANVPAQCLPSVTANPPGPIGNSVYAAQIDANSGNVLATQYTAGSQLTATAVALYGSTLWIAGATTLPDFPFTPNALTLANFEPNTPAGAYLGAVNFSQTPPPAGTPQIACILDAASMAPAGPVARSQLLTIFGTGLGPATGVSAPNGSTGQLAGVNVNFGLNSAPLLYVSSTQINLAVPLVPYAQSSTAMQVEVSGTLSLALELPLNFADPSLFPAALNADGSLNSAANPAKLGSSVSIFVNGLTPDPQITTTPLQLVSTQGWSVTSFAQATPYVVQINLQVPATAADTYSRDCVQYPLCFASFSVYDLNDSALNFGGGVYITEAP
jgi:uncharacterized protein (TIGR03437 family)